MLWYIINKLFVKVTNKARLGQVFTHLLLMLYLHVTIIKFNSIQFKSRLGIGYLCYSVARAEVVSTSVNQ